ncbi:AAA family ATPase [Streptomyces minutiscleroticus]|uniref:AAA family ATPase n=1 Tax=Streptomyces minutiscleroticus TaxID=68238 RepID=UPI0033250DBF
MTVVPALPSHTLIGREDTLGSLEDLLVGLERHTSDLALLTGPAGVGRTALLDRAVARARAAGTAVGVARCSPRESRVPYAVVTQLMASLWPASRIGALAAAEGDAQSAAAVMVRMCDTLLSSSVARPVLLAVDDLHLADPESLRWLVDLSRRLHHGSVLVLGTSPLPLRQLLVAAGAELPDGPCLVRPLRVDPLDAEDSRALLSARAGRPVPPSALSVDAVADGHPAVLCAVADRIAALGRPLEADDVPGLAAAGRAAWSACALSAVRGLPDDAVRLLRVIAAAGRTLDADRIAALAGLADTAFEDAAAVLRSCGLLAGHTGTPRLRHAWFADDVLAGLTRAERDALHVRAAALQGDSGLRIGTVVDMLGAVTGLVRPRTASGPGAGRPVRGADKATTAALRLALREPVPDSERVRLLLRLATAEAVSAPQASDGRLRQVLLRHATEETWPGVLRAADLLLARGDADTARWVIADVHQRALTGIPDPLLRPLRALGRLAQNEKGGLPLVAPAPSHSDRPGHPAQAAVAAWFLATRAEERARVLELARQVSADPEGVPLMCRLAAARALSCADDVPGAVAGFDAVAAEARRSGARAVVAQVLLCHAETAVRLGRPEEALRHLAEAVRELPRASWHSLLLPRLAAAEILALLRCGRVDEARTAAERAAQAPAGEESVATAHLLYARAELALIDEDAPRALLLLEECGRLLRSRRWRNPVLIPWRHTAAVAQHLLGASGTAGELLTEEHRIVEHWGTGRAFTALRARVRETLADHGVDLPEPVDAARPAAASGPAATAGEASAGDVLSASERQVADLVAAGLTNREIADRLGMATRTVELRLTKTYRRLGVRGRAALVAHVLAGRESA